ncbi:hypothetical protein [Jannaschia donghaensis]|uniref:Ada DNA repair metal-binding domain-containing protein n=1 Tax=Jannaschia donghaensis TaxID=420998 RepID=A0A0M6YEN7_9RHOB|nr:hypothetical protein [Jannaschia donghaensis]CTQ48404.1 hypothetical protein JDO7802_00406 [Jannaschia donghaensis]
MTHPNRVQPDGAFLATPARGTLTGNRGVLHDGQTIGPARWKHRAWVSCELAFRGRHRAIMPPRQWTALFFLDEAVAMAAGHRPCGQCRHADYRAFVTAWDRAFGPWPGSQAADATIHAARAHPGAQNLKHGTAYVGDLPDGAMFRTGSDIYLKWHGTALPYGPKGYGDPTLLPDGQITALTNPVFRDILAAGYRPRLHSSAARP